ncbi:hypothetical protein JL37_12630 [Achromobacter sp. RTa]|uniref:DUF2946 domain-containing protein n=1 Tax=Achromobacter sp. RTa TaxID=1532557 RepID=UPI00050E883C|nr:DUF2946 domain-containing protein [Achromobacter sp. RTa]KGD94138.1 hypothetical protein JL37_12630 [Achromobacter sp. RTa]
MRIASFLTRPALWIALAAILWASLAPSLAHALGMGHEGGASRRISVEYCAAEGAALVSLDVRGDDHGAGQDGAHGDGQHCPFCRNPQADAGILPAPIPVLPAPAARAFGYPPLFFLAAHPLHAWSAAQPRAPPAA